MQLLIRRYAARAHDIGKKLFAAPLGDQALPDLAATARDGNNFDLRVLLLKIRQHLFVAADIDRDLAFLLRRREGFFPFELPSGLRFRRMCHARSAANRHEREQAPRRRAVENLSRFAYPTHFSA